MRISTAVRSLAPHREVLSSAQAVGQSLERLSTGSRINRAGDDAGGLSLSEGLRSQATGMRQAARNSRDGIALLRTAEGVLAETTSVLQRMRDLAVRAGNDGGLDDDAKGLLQRETAQLTQELSRIAASTTYNGMPLLDGSYRGSFQVGANAGDTISIAIGAAGHGMDAAGLGVAGLDLTRRAAGAATGTVAAGGGTGELVVRVTAATPGQGNARQAGSVAVVGDFTTPGRYETSYRELAGTLSWGGGTFDLAGVDYTGAVSPEDHRATFEAAVRGALGATVASVDATAGELVLTGTRPRNGATTAEAAALSPTYSAPTPPPTTPPPVTPPPVTPPPPTPPPPTPIDVVDDPVGAIDAAIRRVGAVRADLGALENTLEHTIRRLGVAGENATTAFSRIRDTDMAAEMTALSRNQVLVQSGIAMLAQANLAPRGVLLLLT